MIDFRSHFAIVKSVAQEAAKAMHKPSLSNKEAMAAYARTTGVTGKASFMPEEKSDLIEWSV